MAKYAYAPLSIDDDARRRGGGGGASGGREAGGGSAGAPSASDQLVQERMPLCVGICVLLAIVYVLSRTGDRDALLLDNAKGMQHPSIRTSSPPR